MMDAEILHPPPAERSLARFQRLRRRMLFLLLLLVGGGLLFYSSSPAGGAAHELLEAVGLGLIAVAILGRMWSTLYIGGRKNAEIVMRGPYSLTRNPLYLFSAFGAAGVGAQTGSITVTIFFALMTVLAFFVVIRREERHLNDKFGEAYEAYRARVPRFFPKLSGYDGAGLVSVDPARLYATLRDGLVFLAAIPAFETIEWLQTHGYLPVLLRLP